MSEEPEESQEEGTGERPKGRWVSLVEAAPGEVAALTDSLQDAGIRFIVEQAETCSTFPQPFSVGQVGMLLGERVIVPEEDARRACEVLAEVRRKAKVRAVKDAFDPESLQESLSDPKADPVLKEMAALAGLEPGQHHEYLSARVADWLTENVGEVKIAQYLAAAGLSEEEAGKVVAEVVCYRADLFDQSRARLLSAGRITLITGLLLVLLGICVLIMRAMVAPGLPLAFMSYLPALPVFGFVGICIGYGLIVRARRMRNPAQRPDAN